MTISLNEIATLINQIDAILDESDGEVTSAHIVHNKKTSVYMTFTAFLSEFVDFEIKVNEFSDIPFQLSKGINGVMFSTLLNASQVADLELTMPEQFDYISKKLQMIEGM